MSQQTDEFYGRPELMRKRARSILITRIVATLVALYMLGTLTVVGYNALASIQTRGVLLDCTQPTGKCFGEGQKRTGSLVQQLIDASANGDVLTRHIVILAAACAKQEGVNTADQVEECVTDKLRRERIEAATRPEKK